MRLTLDGKSYRLQAGDYISYFRNSKCVGFRAGGRRNALSNILQYEGMIGGNDKLLTDFIQHFHQFQQFAEMIAVTHGLGVKVKYGPNAKNGLWTFRFTNDA